MNDQTDAVEQPSEEQLAAKKLDWALKALTSITTREKEFSTGWWKMAEDADKVYTADSVDQTRTTPYNILYSNTEVLLPSLYSATPKPDVRTRYKGMDLKPLPMILDRFLTVAADPASPGGDSFDAAMRDATLNALVPGMGYVRIKYIEDRSFPLTYESGHYKTLIWGKTTRWAKTPWIAFKHPMKKNQMFKQFQIPEEDHSDFTPSADGEDDKDDCDVYEFWDKVSRKVFFLCEQWKEKILAEADDPLGMENFYPTPGLLMLTVRTGKYIPIPLYSYYKEQADELNTVSVRLGRILAAIRVRGAYNGLLGDDLKKILAADGIDNELIAASEAGLLAQSGGFDKHIWMVPLEPLVKTAQELYKAREAIKQVIYELTGISDIIRGSSVASETATAQDLKNKWGTVRLRRMQTVVADYARDLFRMSVDCGADHIPPEKWAAITQMLEIPTAQQKAVAVQQLQYLQSQAMNPIPGMPPPQPPDPKLLQQAQSPTWEDLLGKIKNDINRTYVVNIQTSSTIDLDSAQDKGEVAEFMQAMGQLLPALQGLASIGPTGMEAAKAILVNICARFKFGIDIADVIAKIQPPPPPGPDPKDAAKAQESQVKSQQDQQKFQFDMKLGEQKMGMETQRFQMEQAKAQREEMAFQAEQEQKRLIAQEELALKREEMALKREEIRLKTKQLSDNAMYSQQEHTNKLQLLGETTKSNIAQAKQKAIAPKPEPKTTPEQSAAPIIQALEKGFASLTKELTQTITQAAKAPRKAVKSSDGSWTSVAH